MKNKLRITAIILSLTISFMVHPFLSIKAAGADHYSKTGTNDGIYWSLNYIWDYTNTTQMEINGTTFYGGDLLRFEFYFDSLKTGYFTLNYSGVSFNSFDIFLFGGTIKSVSSSNIEIEINEPVDHVTLIIGKSTTTQSSSTALYNSLANNNPSFSVANLNDSNDTVNYYLDNFDTYLSNMEYSLSSLLSFVENTDENVYLMRQNLSTIATQISTYLNYLQTINTTLNTVNSRINTLSTNVTSILNAIKDNTTAIYWYGNMAGNTYQYNGSTTGNFHESSKLISISELNNIRMQITPIIINENYVHISFKFRLSNEYVLDEYKNIKLYIWSQSGGPSQSTLVYTYNLIKDYYIYDRSTDNYVILDCYIPTNVNTTYNSSNVLYYYFDSVNIKNVELVLIGYWGCVENLPAGEYLGMDKTLSDDIENTSQLIDQTVNQAQNIEQVATQYLQGMQFDFTIDQFNPGTGATEYFKTKLQDIYNISPLKPYYLIPIVLFILARILAG